MERDPVCGMEVDPDNATARFEHGGSDYYFCSIGCARRFAEQPDKFAVEKVAAAVAAKVQETAPSGSEAVVPQTPSPILIRPEPPAPVDPPKPSEKDPVCGMTVDPETAAGVVEYRSRKYYFCSKRCMERFNNVPENFVGTLGATRISPPPPAAPPSAIPKQALSGDGMAGPTPLRKSARYTCPMHPEIVKDGPGPCPICGMALEPMDVFAEIESDAEYDSMLRRFWVSAVLSTPLLILSMLGEKLGLHLAPNVQNFIELALATPIVIWGGLPFFERFWDSLVNRSPNMFTLIGLGDRKSVV